MHLFKRNDLKITSIGVFPLGCDVGFFKRDVKESRIAGNTLSKPLLIVADVAKYLRQKPLHISSIKKPQDINYIKQLRSDLNFLSAWPYKETGDAESRFVFWWRLYYVLIEGSFWFLGTTHLKYSFGKTTFFEFGHSLVTHMMNTIATHRTVLPFMKKYRNFIAQFINEIHLFHHKEMSDYAMKTYKQVNKLSFLFGVYIQVLMAVGIFLFNGTPLYDNITSGVFKSNRPENLTFQHAVYFALPFDYTHNLAGYLALFVFDWYISCVCTFYFCLFDMLLTVIVFNVYGHLKILIYHLEHFMVPSTNSTSYNNEVLDTMQFSEEESKIVTQRLKEIILHHRLITTFINKMSDVFGPLVCFNYMFQQISGCILLLECSQLGIKTFMRYGPLTFFVFQELIQTSIVFELIGTMSDKLIDAVYSVPWECMDTKNRKIFYTIMIASQRTTKFKAMGLVDVGVQTMAAILKSIISYFVMLQTVASQ